MLCIVQVPCKILHIPNGSEIKEYWEELKEHFRKKSSPIMMGNTVYTKIHCTFYVILICFEENITLCTAKNICENSWLKQFCPRLHV